MTGNLQRFAVPPASLTPAQADRWLTLYILHRAGAATERDAREWAEREARS